MKTLAFVFLTLSSLSNAYANDAVGGSTAYQWQNGIASCYLQKFSNGQWQNAPVAEVQKSTIVKVIPPAAGQKAVRFYANATWYNAPVSCVAQVSTPIQNNQSNRKVASIDQTSYASTSGGTRPSPELSVFDVYSGFGYLGQNLTIPESTGKTTFPLTSTQIQFQVGVSKYFPIYGNFGWGVNGGFGVGTANVNTVGSPGFNYQVSDAIAYSGRARVGLYYQIIDAFRVGLEPGVSYTLMNLPAAPSGSGLGTPASGTFSVDWQVTAHYKFSKSWGVFIDAGMTQFVSNVMFGAGATFQLSH